MISDRPRITCVTNHAIPPAGQRRLSSVRPEVQPAAPRLIVVRLPAPREDAAEFERRRGGDKAKQLLSSAGVGQSLVYSTPTLSRRRAAWARRRTRDTTIPRCGRLPYAICHISYGIRHTAYPLKRSRSG